MKNLFKSTPNRAFFVALLALLTLTVYAVLGNNNVLLEATSALTIPLFFSIYFIENKYISNIFIAFLLLTFVGDLFSMASLGVSQFKITSVAYFCSFVVLIVMGLFRMKGFKLKGLVGAYLVIVFLLNSYFMYTLYGTLSMSIADSTELFFVTLQIIALLALGFVAFAGYLNKDGRQSIVFLMMSFCLIFSQVLGFIETYYITYDMFVILESISGIAGLVFFYMYVVGHNLQAKKKGIVRKPAVQEKIAA